MLAGCAPWWRADQEFFGRYLEPADASTSGQGGDALTAQGATRPTLEGQRLVLRLSNHGRDPVSLSYVMDEYIAKTFNGRTILLEKDEFLTYPDRLIPGDERSVTVKLPKDVPAREIAQILLRINNGMTVIALKPILPRPSVAETVSAGATSWQPIAVPPVSELWAPSGQPAESVPVVPEPTGAPAKVVDAPPTGTVPVVVEFQQEFGTALKVDIQWDTGIVVTLAHGDHRMFYVVPGLHELSLTSRMPSSEEMTGGRVPVSVSADRPLRIGIDGRARFAGVELRLRQWSGATLLSDQAFAPSTLRYNRPQ